MYRFPIHLWSAQLVPTIVIIAFVTNLLPIVTPILTHDAGSTKYNFQSPPGSSTINLQACIYIQAPPPHSFLQQCLNSPTCPFIHLTISYSGGDHISSPNNIVLLFVVDLYQLDPTIH